MVMASSAINHGLWIRRQDTFRTLISLIMHSQPLMKIAATIDKYKTWFLLPEDEFFFPLKSLPNPQDDFETGILIWSDLTWSWSLRSCFLQS
jgi:hypothetical protein